MDNMLPSSGEEYLRMVKAQARKCPAVVVASGAGAQKHLAAKNTSRKYRTDWQSCLPAPEGCAPTPEWKDQFMKDFTAARASLKRYKQSQERQAKRGGGGAGGGGVRSKQDKRNEQVAIKKDEQDNIPELDSTQPPSSSTSSKPAAATSHPVVLPKMHDEQKWRTLLYGPTPSPSAPVSQVASTTTAVLTEEKWLYAVFLKLDVLVESDQVAVLRNIAKKCARIRSHFHSDSGSKLATVNMVITIVARLFGQGDLE
ncbi:MAG: survival motor neuron interacting protein 1-domain-containing protein [Linnemannia elongata]|nr:MAG: survival motor neuron interacting protein 1-domain-containing protein [Linnemannia elongata]